MDEYLIAKQYLHDNYKILMSLYSMLYTQIESENSTLDPLKLVVKTAYYTVISHLSLNNHPILTLIEAYIKGNQEKLLDPFQKELTLCIIIESKIHDLESCGLIKVNKDNKGNTLFYLTDNGKEYCLEKGLTLEEMIDFTNKENYVTKIYRYFEFN